MITNAPSFFISNNLFEIIWPSFSYKDISSGRKALRKMKAGRESEFYANFIAQHKSCSEGELSLFRLRFFLSLIAYKFKIIHQKADVEASSFGWRRFEAVRV